MSFRLAGLQLALFGILLGMLGCNTKSKDVSPSSTGDSGQVPTFSLAWSEYPSWSVFGVAHELGIVNGAAGQLGELERKHGVDIELKQAGYDSCLNMFASGNCDAVCMTNMDALISSASRSGVAVLPTSTSLGADACLVTDSIPDIEALKGKPVHGLQSSVSQYCFVRCLEKAGFDEKDFTFTNQDPAVAAQIMQQGAETHQAIMVWNPFVLQTLRQRSDVRVLFDSTQIPNEIVDMIVMGADALEKPGADKFLRAISEAFYQVSDKAHQDTPEGREVLVAIGKKFSNLGPEDMQLVIKQTVFYRTPSDAKALINGEDFKKVMDTVKDFCVNHGLVTDPSIGFGPDAGTAKLRFDISWMTP
jgi:NitT/TauT family transport system substrate-binding protein